MDTKNEFDAVSVLCEKLYRAILQKQVLIDESE
jgi:hypothetical protein